MSHPVPISVIVCTHNPRQEYLRRALEALKAQTLPANQWEFLLVDNASRDPLAIDWDLSWHPQARHIREDKLGLTPARLRGIAESKGELLVFVDDDNILDIDYLQLTLEIGRIHPHLGAWGGSYLPEFEIPPANYLEKYLGRLAISTPPFPRWGNSYVDFEAMPAGAGMTVRRQLGEQYKNTVTQCEVRKQLGRIGKSLSSCEDIDLAWTACDMGFGVGRFPDLKLTHIIPRQRLEPEYMLALIEGNAASRVMLDYARKQKTFSTGVKFHLLRTLWLRFRMSDFDYRAWKATRRGIKKGISLLASTGIPKR